MAKSPKPAASKRGRGRPSIPVTDEMRDRVAQQLAVGDRVDDIALGLGVTARWLQLRMPDVMKAGRAKKRAEVVGLLFASAQAGNVAAQKHLEQMTGTAAAAESVRNPTAPQERPVRLGKKEQARQDALTAGVGSEWGEDLRTDVPN